MLWRFSGIATVLLSSLVKGWESKGIRIFGRTDIPSHSIPGDREYQSSGWFGAKQKGARHMPIENEVLRLKRERDFQARVLDAVERPKRHRVWVFFNSALFIWAMSAFFLTLGGFYFTTFQKCIADSRKLSDTLSNNGEEIRYRLRQISAAVLRANNIREIAETIKTPGYVYSELKDKTIGELTGLLRRAYSRTLIVGNRPANPLQIPREDKILDYFANDQMTYPLLFGKTPPMATDDDLRALKIGATQLGITGVELDRISLTDIFRPSCTPDKIIAIAIGNDPPIVNVSYEPSAPPASIEKRK